MRSGLQKNNLLTKIVFVMNPAKQLHCACHFLWLLTMMETN